MPYIFVQLLERCIQLCTVRLWWMVIFFRKCSQQFCFFIWKPHQGLQSHIIRDLICLKEFFSSVRHLFSLEFWMEIKITNPEVRPQSQWYPENSWVSINSTHPPPLHESSHRSARRQTIARLLGTANEYRYPLVLTHIALLSLQCWSGSWVEFLL